MTQTRDPDLPWPMLEPDKPQRGDYIAVVIGAVAALAIIVYTIVVLARC